MPAAPPPADPAPDGPAADPPGTGDPGPGRRPTWVVVVAVVTVLAGLLAVALAVIEGRDGAGDPATAAERFFTGLSSRDVVGTFEALTPAERTPLVAATPDLLAELSRLGLIGPVDARSVAGLSVGAEDLQFRTVKLSDRVEAVDVVAGRFTVVADDAALPVTDDGRAVLDEFGVDPATSPDGVLYRRDFAQYPFRLVAVEDGGGWHISLAYTVAENLRPTDAADRAIGGGRIGNGAADPEGAVRELVGAYVDGDPARALASLDPDDTGVFADYARVFVPDLDTPRGAGTLHRLDLTTTGDGPQRTVRVDALDADLDDVVQTIHVEAGDGCLSSAYRFGDDPPYARFTACGRGTDRKVIGEGAADADVDADAAAERESLGESASSATTTTVPSAGPEKPPIKGTPEEARREREENARQTRPIDNAVAALALFGNGSELPPFTVVEHDGRWYVSPVRTLVGGVLDTLRRAPDPEAAAAIVREVRDELEPRRSLVLEEAADPDNILFGPPAERKNPLVPACFVRLASIGGEGAVNRYGGDCVAHLIATGRARPEDTPLLFGQGDCLEAEPTAPPDPGAGLRRIFLTDRAVRRCLQAEVDAGRADPSVFDALNAPADQVCFAPYQALAAEAPEADWAAADAAVLACAQDRIGGPSSPTGEVIPP